MSKVGGLAFIKWGGGGLFTFILNRLLVFNMFFMTTSNFGGPSPPLSKSGGLKPPCCPRFSASGAFPVPCSGG